MSKTAAGLIAFAKSKIGTPYVYGAKGTVMSLTKIQALRKVYGSNCVWKSDDKKAGKVCVDCSGLISWYTGIVRGSGQYRSTAVEVIPISKRSDAHIGWAVWMNGHIGIYLGNDQYIAADGSAYGVRIANLSQNGFTHLLNCGSSIYLLRESRGKNVSIRKESCRLCRSQGQGDHRRCHNV